MAIREDTRSVQPRVRSSHDLVPDDPVGIEEATHLAAARAPVGIEGDHAVEGGHEAGHHGRSIGMEGDARFAVRLTDETIVLAIDPENEKANTLRVRILRVAKDRKMDVAVQVRQDQEGQRLLVGLMTAARKPTRGRRPKAA